MVDQALLDAFGSASHVFSLTLTERCNLACSYCHFYRTTPRTSKRDMPGDLIATYLDFIRHFRELVPGDVAIRFSGGDPIVLKEQLFQVADLVALKTGLRPYLLTGGHGIDQKWVARARRSALGAVAISLENPFDPDPGSVPPMETISKVRDLTSVEVPLEFGVTIVKNSSFRHIFEICRIVYEETGTLPKLNELNYQAYESPTDEQLGDLFDNLAKVVERYHEDVALDMFSYISPEFTSAHRGKPMYLSECDIGNRRRVGDVPDAVAFQSLFESYQLNYPRLDCADVECDWHLECQRIKWLWLRASDTVPAAQKKTDYCRFKKTINGAFAYALRSKVDEAAGARI